MVTSKFAPVKYVEKRSSRVQAGAGQSQVERSAEAWLKNRSSLSTAFVDGHFHPVLQSALLYAK